MEHGWLEYVRSPKAFDVAVIVQSTAVVVSRMSRFIEAVVMLGRFLEVSIVPSRDDRSPFPSFFCDSVKYWLTSVNGMHLHRGHCLSTYHDVFVNGILQLLSAYTLRLRRRIRELCYLRQLAWCHWLSRHASSVLLTLATAVK